jgi:hypothetical protein
MLLGLPQKHWSMALSADKRDRAHGVHLDVMHLPERSSSADLEICPRRMQGVAVGIEESEPIAGVCDVLGCTRQ